MSKERVITGKVRIETLTREREELVDELLAREDAEIERRPIGKTVDALPAVRQEGNTVIIPLVEEVLAIERRLMVKEEIRIRLVNRKQRCTQRVRLRRQEAVIDRLPAAAPESPTTDRSQAEPANHRNKKQHVGEE